MRTMGRALMREAAMMWCLLTGGHDSRKERGRMVCWSCGYQSSGFTDDDGLGARRRHGTMFKVAQRRTVSVPTAAAHARQWAEVEERSIRAAARAADPALKFEQQTLLELAVGHHQKPAEWRGNRKVN